MKTNEINQDRLIEALYYELYNEELSKNVVETKELSALYIEYYNRYTAPLLTIMKTPMDEAGDMLNDLVYGYCRRGFEVGFKAALALLNTDTKAVKV